jgi:Gpi18-like mannosyltransferase
LPPSVAIPQSMCHWCNSAGHYQFCEAEHYKGDKDVRPFCLPGGANLYSYVQSTYWGVGFLRYYTLKQVLNSSSSLALLCLMFFCTDCVLV